MRHASIAILFGMVCLLAAIGQAVMSSTPVDPGFDGDGYRTFPTTEEAMDYAIRQMAVMDSIAREDSLFLNRLDENGFNIDEECGQ